MDKKVVLAVAGSGKTRSIIDKLSLEKRALIITYTNNNYANLRQRVIEKFGEVPANISLYTYFSFLYSFCYLPCVYHKVSSRSINYNEKHEVFPRKGATAANPIYYLDYNNNLLGNRLALLVNNFALDDVKLRIQKFYDQFVIDEVQDFSANDFNFINALAEADVDILYVGDYFQHTYDTSRDGNTRQNLYKNGYEEYKKQFNKVLEIDDQSLLTSYRCSKTICDFVTSNLGVAIEAYKNNETTIEVVKDEDLIKEHMTNSDIPKLFYQAHSNYDCLSTNWGASKGIDHFVDVCVVFNLTTWPMVERNDFSKIAPSTKNKLYVALTRARRNVYFINENDVKKEYLKTN
jgi:superfamily I DNA/RNA helicase